MNQYPTDAHEEARTGLAGPLWGAGAAVLTALLGGLFSSSVMLSIAAIAASINLFNLVPVWQLDGARGLHALDRGQRFWIAGVGLLCAIATHQWLPGIVGLIAATRAFGVGGPSHSAGDRGMLWLFVSLIVVLSLIATLPVTMPGQAG
jgi:membrane-associated protease RseP (regulator of RpoE activity)